ncbi:MULTISPECIES: CocE/NonD family hydrolase [Aphanothece]|uniref:CocE/NonD family hydrolase n=1 Tax=Aphanothece TaxID=1121 RepID=UPI003984A581
MKGAAPAGPGSLDAWLTCRDGIRLVSRIWSPPGDGPWPVLLMRQPYGRAIASTVTYAHPSWYAAHGFLVVVQDVRGQGDSEGAFGGFAQEARDGADTLRWARQLEGSNGRLGCYGFSYQGVTQLLSDAPEAMPDCLAPAMAGCDERLHWASSGGAHWWSLGLGWGLQLAAQRCRRDGDGAGWAAIRQSLASGTFPTEGAALLKRHDPEGMAQRWLALDPAVPEAWPRHEPQPGIWQRPMLLIGGWHDPHLEGVLDLWSRSRQGGGRPLLRIGAWSHLQWGGGLDRLQLAFFRHHLQDAPPDPELQIPVALQDSRSGTWQAIQADAGHDTAGGSVAQQRCTWGLHTDGLACQDSQGSQLVPLDGSGPSREAQPTAATTVTLVHDPWRPVPGRGGHLGLDAGPCERDDLDGRGDVACFSSAPLVAPLRLIGRPLLQIPVAADQPGFDLCAALAVVEANGRTVRQLCTGVARHLGSGCREARAREVRFQPLLATLKAGERLRLSVAAAAWPQIAVNPGSGEPPLGPVGPGHRVITLTLATATATLELEPCFGEKAGANCGDLVPPP